MRNKYPGTCHRCGRIVPVGAGETEQQDGGGWRTYHDDCDAITAAPPRARKRRQPPYDTMSDAERWAWHANNYAFRAVVLHQPLSGPNPCDPDREWYDEGLVRTAIARRRSLRREYTPMALEGRDIANAWARDLGYYDMSHALDEGRSYAELIRSILGTASPL